jgi:uncharacterized membrane protein YcaP (DUF421 family)
MTDSWHALLDIAIRTTVVYLVLLVGIRLTGQRQLGQMTPFDLVLLLIIANAVQNAMVGPDTSLVGGLVAAGVLLVWRGVIDRIRHANRGLAKLISGEGIMLINGGKVLHEHLQRSGVTIDELLQALREHGVGTVADVRLAVLEPDGAISVIRFDDLKPGAHNQPHHRIKGIRRGDDR